jgi:hypothetical protein
LQTNNNISATAAKNKTQNKINRNLIFQSHNCGNININTKDSDVINLSKFEYFVCFLPGNNFVIFPGKTWLHDSNLQSHFAQNE